MLKAVNEQVDIFSKASFAMRQGLIYVGDGGIEFYDYASKRNFVQIPWKEVYQIRAQVFWGGKYIRGFFVDTQKTGNYNFLVTNAKDVLRAMRPYLREDQLLRAKTLTSKIAGIFKKT